MVRELRYPRRSAPSISSRRHRDRTFTSAGNFSGRPLCQNAFRRSVRRDVKTNRIPDESNSRSFPSLPFPCPIACDFLPPLSLPRISSPPITCLPLSSSWIPSHLPLSSSVFLLDPVSSSSVFLLDPVSSPRISSVFLLDPVSSPPLPSHVVSSLPVPANLPSCVRPALASHLPRSRRLPTPSPYYTRRVAAPLLSSQRVSSPPLPALPVFPLISSPPNPSRLPLISARAETLTLTLTLNLGVPKPVLPPFPSKS